jgi:hypothetical protein
VKRSGRDESIQVVIHLCMDAMLGISLYSYSDLNKQNLYVFLIIAYVFSSTKLEKRAEQVLPGSKGRWDGGEGGRNDPNNVCAYDYMNKEKKKRKEVLV